MLLSFSRLNNAVQFAGPVEKYDPTTLLINLSKAAIRLNDLHLVEIADNQHTETAWFGVGGPARWTMEYGRAHPHPAWLA